jgi:hypothetical protein
MCQLTETPKKGIIGASNFHLLELGAGKSSLYRLGLLSFDAQLFVVLLFRVFSTKSKSLKNSNK